MYDTHAVRGNCPDLIGRGRPQAENSDLSRALGSILPIRMNNGTSPAIAVAGGQVLPDMTKSLEKRRMITD
jgi:hypothetical protein